MDYLAGLFLETLADLEKRLAQPNAYDLLMCSALLRKLLLDGEPLMDKVNKRHRLKVTFEVGTNPPGMVLDEHTMFWVMGDSFNPKNDIAFGAERLKREKFLGVKVAYIRGVHATVHDVIDQLAHVAGGVHAGAPDSDIQKALTAFSASWLFSGYPGPFFQLRSIAPVVLDGLAPLRQAVAENGI